MSDLRHGLDFVDNLLFDIDLLYDIFRETRPGRQGHLTYLW